jgi:hypothetical protein
MGAVAEAVRNLGGRIGARSEAGVGTTITIDIPKDQHSSARPLVPPADLDRRQAEFAAPAHSKS